VQFFDGRIDISELRFKLSSFTGVGRSINLSLEGCRLQPVFMKLQKAFTVRKIELGRTAVVSDSGQRMGTDGLQVDAARPPAFLGIRSIDRERFPVMLSLSVDITA